MKFLAAIAIPILAVGEAAACTLCHSSVADAVRRQLIGPDFAAHAAGIGVTGAAILIAASIITRRL